MVLPPAASSPFGSRSRTRILVALRLLGSSYPRELARRLGTPIFAIRKALAGLERDGLVTNRLVGRTRVYSLSHAYLAHRELAALLWRLAELDADPARARAAAESLDAPRSEAPAVEGAAVESPAERALRPPRRSAADEGWKNW